MQPARVTDDSVTWKFLFINYCNAPWGKTELIKKFILLLLYRDNGDCIILLLTTFNIILENSLKPTKLSIMTR